MLKLERKNMIIKYLEEHESATVEELSKKLGVSPMTIRRDFQSLEDSNMLTRTFGGAVLRSKLTTEIPYKNKSISHKEEKKRIAKYSASLVQDGQIVLLDSGTTNMEIAKLLKQKKDLTIITTDIKIAGYLAFSTDFKILCTGGIIQNSTGTCFGSSAVEFLKNINVNIGFIATSSIDVDKGISTPTLQKADIKKQIVECSDTCILVADRGKFNKRSFIKICDLDVFDEIVTDADLDKDTYDLLKNKTLNIKLV